MAKKYPKRKPREGENVFLRGESRYVKMLFRKKIKFEGEELAYCTWIIPNINDSNLDKCELGYFPLHLLTLEPPATPSQIFPGQIF